MRDLYAHSPDDDEWPCHICGNNTSDCQCPICPTCLAQGDPACIGVHAPATLWQVRSLSPPPPRRRATHALRRGMIMAGPVEVVCQGDWNPDAPWCRATAQNGRSITGTWEEIANFLGITSSPCPEFPVKINFPDTEASP